MEERPWRVYTDEEIEAAQRVLKRRFRMDILEAEAIWYLRDQHEPGWRHRKGRPDDKFVYCLTSAGSEPSDKTSEPS
jgi:hypothetical protein